MTNLLNKEQGYIEGSILTVYNKYGKAVSVQNIYVAYTLIIVFIGILFFY